jgi:hypothetical protein
MSESKGLVKVSTPHNILELAVVLVYTKISQKICAGRCPHSTQPASVPDVKYNT